MFASMMHRANNKRQAFLSGAMWKSRRRAHREFQADKHFSECSMAIAAATIQPRTCIGSIVFDAHTKAHKYISSRCMRTISLRAGARNFKEHAATDWLIKCKLSETLLQTPFHRRPSKQCMEISDPHAPLFIYIAAC
jgi:hypothetical protein